MEGTLSIHNLRLQRPLSLPHVHHRQCLRNHIHRHFLRAAPALPLSSVPSLTIRIRRPSASLSNSGNSSSSSDPFYSPLPKIGGTKTPRTLNPNFPLSLLKLPVFALFAAATALFFPSFFTIRTTLPALAATEFTEHDNYHNQTAAEDEDVGKESAAEDEDVGKECAAEDEDVGIESAAEDERTESAAKDEDVGIESAAEDERTESAAKDEDVGIESAASASASAYCSGSGSGSGSVFSIEDDGVAMEEGIYDVEEEEEEGEEGQGEEENEEVESLTALLQDKAENGDEREVLQVASKLVELQPDLIRWRLLKGHLHINMSNYESARSEFEAILQRHPSNIDAYRGLIVAASQLKVLADDENVYSSMDEPTEARLIYAIYRIYKEDYQTALKMYRELAQEKPNDYRAYLCQGLIYNWLRQKDEAQKNFDKYMTLIPEGQRPYTPIQFQDN